MGKEKMIDGLIEAITSKGLGEGEGWPLLAPQIVSYFDIDQALVMFDAIERLVNAGKTDCEIGRLFEHPTSLRYFLSQNAIIGLKLSNSLNIKKIDPELRVQYIEKLLSVLEKMVRSDLFVLEGKNLILNKAEISTLINLACFLDVNKENKRKVLELTIDLFNYGWANYYSAFLGRGYEIHGPYDVKIEGNDYVLVVRENLEIDPEGLTVSPLGVRNIKTLLIFEKGVDFRLNFYNQPISESHNDRLVRVAFFVDDNPLVSMKDISDWDSRIEKSNLETTKFVNNLPVMDKVRRGAQICIGMYSEVMRAVEVELDPQRSVNSVYEKVGDKFATRAGGNNFQNRSQEEWAKIYDPRTDYLGDLVD